MVQSIFAINMRYSSIEMIPHAINLCGFASGFCYEDSVWGGAKVMSCLKKNQFTQSTHGLESGEGGQSETSWVGS